MCLAGFGVVSSIIFLAYETRRPTIRVGASEAEYHAYVRAEDVSARRWRLPRKQFIALQGRPWQKATLTQYYFRDGHYFLTRSVGFEITNGVLTRVEAPYWKWHLDL